MQHEIPMPDRFAPGSLRGLLGAFLLLAGGAFALIEATGGIESAPPPIATVITEETRPALSGIDADAPIDFSQSGLAEVLF